MKTRRLKPRINEMIPVKKWLSLSEACAYMDVSQNYFLNHVANNLSLSSPTTNKRYYKVSEIDNFLEKQILIQAS